MLWVSVHLSNECLNVSTNTSSIHQTGDDERQIHIYLLFVVHTSANLQSMADQIVKMILMKFNVMYSWRFHALFSTELLIPMNVTKIISHWNVKHWNMIYVEFYSDWQEPIKQWQIKWIMKKPNLNEKIRGMVWCGAAWHEYVIVGFVFCKPKFACKFTCENYCIRSAFNIVSVFLFMCCVHSVRSLFDSL